MTSSEHHARIKQVFLGACERGTEHRASFLEETCGSDRALRREVEALLARHDPSALEEGAANAGLAEGKRFAAGEVFAGRYRIVSSLGHGGMGEVYRADDLTLGVPVALKFLLAEGSRNLERLLNEVRLTREVSHPAVCRVFDVGEAEGQTFFTMEYIEGEDLASQLRRIGPLPASKVLELAGEICGGLAAAHERGVLHRDLKPANIMVDAGGHARIVDFGIAIREGTEDGNPVGTPAYMAPEQLAAGGEVTEQADLYALGLVLYELLTGRRVFGANTVAERRKLQRSEPERSSTWALKIDARIEGVVLQALREDPRERPSSARAMAQMLEEGASEAGAGSAVQSTGEQRQLTVMFCELETSARGPGDLDPEELSELIRTYQQRVARVVERYGGRVAQYLGDGVLCHFGYPQAHEDDALRALSAGLEVLDERPQQLAGPDARAAVQVTLGIDTGRVVFGETEESERDAPVAVGEAVNAAIHLIRVAEPGELVIGERTRRLVQEAFVVEELGGKSLTRATDPRRVYRVLRATGATPASPTPLIGREPELALLRNRWEQAMEGRGQVVLLSGEPGIGKSRLIRALQDSLSDERQTWLECRSSAFHTHSPFHLVIDLAERVLRFDDEQSAEEKLERLERGLGLVGLASAETLPLLASLLSLPLPEHYAPLEIGSQLQRQKTLEVLLSWVLELGGKQPLVLIVEDLHWADPSSLEWLGMLVEQVPTASLLVVLATRPEVEVTWTSRSHVLQLTLSPLSPKQIVAMVETITGSTRIPPPLLDRVVKRTDGVPLFVEELTKSVLESGGLSEAQGDPQPDLLPDLAIPATLQGSLMARLDRLGSAKAVAQLAAVLGRKFSYELLEAVSPMADGLLEPALARLVHAELVYQRGAVPDAAYSFKHALIRDTAYQSLLKKRRQELHGGIADAFENQFPERVRSEPELIARHCEEAGRTAPAIGHYQRAAERAAQRWAQAEAIDHLNKAIVLLRTLPEDPDRNEQELQLQVALGVSLIAAKGYGDPDVERVHERGRALCGEVGDSPERFRALIGLSVFYHNRSELRAACDLAEQALALAERSDEAFSLVVAHARLGSTLHHLGELTRAHEHFEQAIRHSDPAEHRSLVHVWGQDWEVFSRTNFVGSLNSLGYPDRARHEMQQTLELARERDLFSLALSLVIAAAVHYSLRERARALELAEDCVAIAKERGYLAFGVGARVIRGLALGGLQGLEELESGIAATVEGRMAVYLPQWYGYLAEVTRELGRTDDALAALDAGFASRNDCHHWDAELHRLKGEVLLQRDEPTEAEGCFHRALEVARDQQAKSFELRAATSLARLWQHHPRRAEGRATLASVYDWFTEGFDTADLKDAKALLEQLS